MNISPKCGLTASALVFFALSSVAQQAPDKPVPAANGASATASANSADGASRVPNAGSNIGEPVYQVAASVRPPIAIHTPDPKFTKEAREAKFSGNVVIALIVDSHGNPRDVHVLRGVGMFGLDDAALHAVEKYRFKPALQNGVPVAVHLNVEVNFIFQDKS